MVVEGGRFETGGWVCCPEEGGRAFVTPPRGELLLGLRLGCGCGDVGLSVGKLLG